MLKSVEQEMGRTQEDRLAGIVKIDLDILQFDDTRHHERDWQRPYVIQLIKEL
jgi:2-amino-4-hydroxy-6-hydroxymethyldihydropteridine diphosphokinase